MMLPTSLPPITMFNTVTGGRPDHKWLMALLVIGYLSIWMGFGVLIHLGDLVLHAVVEQSAWLEANSWFIGAGVLILAGVYQFTPLKYQCLDKFCWALDRTKRTDAILSPGRGSRDFLRRLLLVTHAPDVRRGGRQRWLDVGVGDIDGHREEYALGASVQ